jgi:hypothetical protein
MKSHNSAKEAGCFGLSCGCIWLIILFVNLTIGAFCFSYCMNSFFGVNPAWYWDILGGLFLGEAAIPIAVITYIIHSGCGVPTPFFPH